MIRLLAFVLLIAAACRPDTRPPLAIDTLPGGVIRVWSASPSQWADSAEFEFVEVATLTPGPEGRGEFDPVRSLALGADGEVYVAQNPARIDRFDRDGRWHRTVGRAGSGPGEYRSPILTVVGTDLVVHDPNASRASVFDSAGAFLRSWQSTCCAFRAIGHDAEGRVYLPLMGRDSGRAGLTGHVRFGMEGQLVDTLWPRRPDVEPAMWVFSPGPGSIARYTIPFQPALIDRPWSDGGLIYGDQRSYTFVLSRAGTDSVRIFGREFVPVPLSDSLRREVFQGMTGGNTELLRIASLSDIPTTAPAFRSFQEDGTGRLWVNVTPHGDRGRLVWDLFGPDGAWLGTAVAPFTAYDLAIRGDRLVAARVDEDGLTAVTLYRIVQRMSR